jgi:elongation factor Ts
MSTTVITAKDVAELRQRTSAGMMDCKKALEETGGDMDKAVEYLRKKGIAKAEKRAGRAASEGRIVAIIAPDTKSAALIELNSETDFVARNESFGALAQSVAQAAFRDTANNAVVSNAAEGSLMSQPWYDDASKTVQDVVKEASGKTGENVVLRRYARFTTDGTIGSYVHHNGKVAVLVEVSGASNESANQLARSVAEHVAAGVPTVAIAVNREDVSQDIVDRERRIFEEQAKSSGKPDNIVQKMVDGRIQKFYQEVTVLEQPWVRDDSKSIKQLVADMSKQAGAPLTIRRFVRFQMGEE